MLFILFFVLAYFAVFAFTSYAIKKLSAGIKEWKLHILLSLNLTLFWGFIIPCCWSKYGELIPAPMIIAFFNESCIERYYYKMPMYFAIWFAIFFIFSYPFRKY